MKTLLVWLCLFSSVLAQGVLPEVDGDEVIRRGNYVERVDGFGSEDDPIGEAMAPPEDDSYKLVRIE